ncbi:MAG: hypothetical protein J6U54_08870 [Clostridiales bacterium]|nr:hypothetical protein [Clostridiales bacterium]
MWQPTVSSDTIWHSALAHSAKGTSWIKKEHKYIEKRNGRYIYKTKDEIKEARKKEKARRKALAKKQRKEERRLSRERWRNIDNIIKGSILLSMSKEKEK